MAHPRRLEDNQAGRVMPLLHGSLWCKIDPGRWGLNHVGYAASANKRHMRTTPATGAGREAAMPAANIIHGHRASATFFRRP